MGPSLAERVREVFEQRPEPVVAVYLFGSRARGTARPDSDLDLGLLYATPPAATLAAQPYALADDLRAALGVPVDLVVLNTAPPDLVHRVLRDGELVLDRDRSARIRFEVAARNLYFDLKPHLDRYRRVV